MKRVKGIKRATHKLVSSAVRDYFGQYDLSQEKITMAVEGLKVDLTQEQKSDVWAIKTNLEDLIYKNELLKVI